MLSFSETRFFLLQFSRQFWLKPPLLPLERDTYLKLRGFFKTPVIPMLVLFLLPFFLIGRNLVIVTFKCSHVTDDKHGFLCRKFFF